MKKAELKKRVMSLLLAGCLIPAMGVAPVKADDLPSKTLSLIMSTPPILYDPINVTQGPIGERTVFEAVLEPLIISDGMGNYYPWLAESYEYNEDATEWTFHIREGVTFSNGEEMNADDVVATFERILDYDNNDKDPTIKTRINNVWPDHLLQSVEKVDDYTVKVDLGYTYANSLISFTDVAIIPDEAYAERGDDLWLDQTENGYFGTGPWILTEHINNQSATFKKNPNYWNKNYDSYYDTLQITFVTEQTTAIAACISGSAQGYIPSGGIKPDLLPQFDSVTDTFDVFDTEQKSFFYLQFECGEGSVFADERMREAFWSSINFDDIAQYVLGGGTTMTQFIPDGFEGYDESLPAYEYNPERAAELLQECGYDGSEIDIYSSITTYMSEDQLLAIADYANSVGFNCVVHTLENADLDQYRKSGTYDIFMAPANFADASPILNLMSRIYSDQDCHNLKDDELMEDIRLASVTVDKEEREDYLHKAMARIRELWGPQIGMYYATQHAALNYGITGVEFAVGSQIYLQFVDYNVDDPTSTDHGVDWEKLTQGL